MQHLLLNSKNKKITSVAIPLKPTLVSFFGLCNFKLKQRILIRIKKLFTLQRKIKIE